MPLPSPSCACASAAASGAQKNLLYIDCSADEQHLVAARPAARPGRSARERRVVQPRRRARRTCPADPRDRARRPRAAGCTSAGSGRASARSRTFCSRSASNGRFSHTSRVDRRVEHERAGAAGEQRRVGRPDQRAVRDADVVELLVADRRAEQVEVAGDVRGVEVREEPRRWPPRTGGSARAPRRRAAPACRASRCGGTGRSWSGRRSRGRPACSRRRRAGRSRRGRRARPNARQRGRRREPHEVDAGAARGRPG